MTEPSDIDGSTTLRNGLHSMENTHLRYQLQALNCLTEDAVDRLCDLLDDELLLEGGQHWADDSGEIQKAYVIADGWAIRHKTLSDGRRQILNFLVPGDMIGFFALLFRRAVVAVEPLTPIRVHSFTADRAFAAFRHVPELAVALSWLACQSERQLNEHLVRVGRRSAKERMAHLFMELNYRLLRAGIPGPAAELLPLTQPLLADSLGMSHIHAHRTFRRLVHDGLVTLAGGRIRLKKLGALTQLAGFDPGYLEQNSLPSKTRAALMPQANTDDTASSDPLTLPALIK